MWCIPPKENAAFVCAMENVLETYKKPYDEKRPVVCMDETSKQMVKETRTPIACAPGRPQRFDYEYQRNGVMNIFLFCEPLRGWRYVDVTERRTKKDWAHQIQRLVDEQYPDAEKITLVMDNLNTHRLSSLYETFPPAEARRLVEKLDIVYTPKHGSWLNVAEIEFAAMNTQCIGGRIDDADMLESQLAAWETDRNDASRIVDWQFTTDDARIKLRRLYTQTSS